MVENRTNERSWRPDAADTKQAIVEAGYQLIADEGVALAADRVSIERAAAMAKVSRAAAYKLWSGLDQRPQDAFRNDVICFAAEDAVLIGSGSYDATSAAVSEMLDGLTPISGLDAPERREAFRTIVKTGARENFRQLVDRPEWRVHLATLAAVRSQRGGLDPAHGAVSDAIRRGSERAAKTYAPLYVDVTERFGMRLRAGYEIDHFAIAAGALAEGLVLRALTSRFIDDIEGPYADDGSWHLFAVGLLGLVREFFEPHPEIAWATTI
ncbi:MAG: hypothetical protein ACK5OX_02845 [Desertimonas sp.]